MTFLKDAGAGVNLAVDGEKVVSMLQESPVGYYDLILMDIQMPHRNGYEAAEYIRLLPDEHAQIPIIAITANAFEEDWRKALETGMNGYVTKPIKIEKLITVIRKTIL